MTSQELIFQNLRRKWLVVCRSRDLGSKPLACRLLGELLVLFRSGKKIAALADRCPHRNVPLSAGRLRGPDLQCAYHGWVFDANGICQSVPGRSKQTPSKTPCVAAYQTHEQDGLIRVRLTAGPAAAESPVSEHPGKQAFHRFVWSARIKGTLVNALENFLDGTHTHFVHSGLVRTDRHRQNVTARLVKTSDRVTVCYSGEAGQSGLISRLLEWGRTKSYGRYIDPATAKIEYLDKSGAKLSITVYFAPICQTEQLVHAVIATRKGILPGMVHRLILTPLFRKVMAEDQKILALQQQTIEKTGEAEFLSSEIDLMRPYIEAFLTENQDSNLPPNREITLFL